MFRIRLTGISTPFGGLSWEYQEPYRKLAERLITFLEDRRVITDRQGHAGVLLSSSLPYTIKSVRQIRDRLREDLEKIDRTSKFAESMRAMQKACRRLLDNAEGETYSAAVLDEFRKVMAEHMLRIAAAYGFSIEAEQEDWGDDENMWREAYKKLWNTGQYRLVREEADNGTGEHS